MLQISLEEDVWRELYCLNAQWLFVVWAGELQKLVESLGQKSLSSKSTQDFKLRLQNIVNKKGPIIVTNVYWKNIS